MYLVIFILFCFINHMVIPRSFGCKVYIQDCADLNFCPCLPTVSPFVPLWEKKKGMPCGRTNGMSPGNNSNKITSAIITIISVVC